jgi:carbonic anhydrase/acetyltransferase-like protein (isoleucine patch superfamily)
VSTFPTSYSQLASFSVLFPDRIPFEHTINMPIYKLADLTPAIHETALVVENATIVGNVTIGERTSIWFGVSIRGDNEAITIGAGSNVQENAVLHADPGFPLEIGPGVTVGHQAMLHGCTIEEGTLIGIQAVVLNGAKIGKNCLVGAGAVITEGKAFPDNSLILGAPAKLARALSDEQIARLKKAADGYVERSRRYKTELVRVG